jgi:Domain of unknown function (DUF202)
MKDGGLQPERTSLAWSRTGVLAFLVSLLCIRTGVSATSIAHLTTATILGSVSGAMFYQAHLRSHFDPNLSEVVGDGSRRIKMIASSSILAVAALHELVLLWRHFIILG